MSVSKEKLHSRPTSPFDFWRLDLAGSQFEIGQQLADFALTTLDQPWEREEPSGADAEALDEVFQTYCPVLSQRAAGVAAQLAKSGVQGNPYTLPMVDEPQPFACSCASFSGASGPMLIRNFDFTLRSFADLVGRPASQMRPMVDPVILMKIEPDIGRSTISLVGMDLFLGAIDGINDVGFCAALLSLSNENLLPQAARFDRVDELSVVRILLEQCECVREAVELFRDLPKYTVFLPCHYIVADRHGDSAVLEWDENGTHVTHGARAGGLVCTNHRVAMPGTGGTDAAGSDDAGSVERYEDLSAALQGLNLDRDAAWRAAERVSLNAFDPTANIFGGTLWTGLYGLDPPSLELRMLGQLEDGVGRYNAVPIQHLRPAWSRSA